jgi:MarR family transcriptional regulator, organic hydroperoxide resistance regulator
MSMRDSKIFPGSAEQTLGFLIADAARAYRRVWSPMIARHGVSAGIFPFLRIISERDGLTFSELAGAVHMRAPTTVNIVKEMEVLGFVRRARNRDDARKVNLFLTAKGRRAWKSVQPEVRKINQHAQSGLTAAEQGELKRLLRRVRSNFDTAP